MCSCSYIPSSSDGYKAKEISYKTLVRTVISYLFKYKKEISRDKFERSVFEISMDLWYIGIKVTFDELTIKSNGVVLVDGNKMKNYRLYGELPLGKKQVEHVILPLSMMDLDFITEYGISINLETIIKNNEHNYFKEQPYTRFILENMEINSIKRSELSKDTFNDYVQILKYGMKL